MFPRSGMHSILLRGNIPFDGNNLFVVWYCEMTVCVCTEIPYFRLKGNTIFLRKFSRHCQSFARKPPAVLEILNIVVQEGKFVHSVLPLFMELELELELELSEGDSPGAGV